MTDYIWIAVLIAAYVGLIWATKAQSDQEYEREHRKDD